MTNCTIYVYHDSDDLENVKKHNKALLEFLDQHVEQNVSAGYIIKIKLVRSKKELAALQKKGFTKLPAMKAGAQKVSTASKIIKFFEQHSEETVGMSVDEVKNYHLQLIQEPDEPDDENNRTDARRMAAYEQERRSRMNRNNKANGQDAKSMADSIKNSTGYDMDEPDDDDDDFDSPPHRVTRRANPSRVASRTRSGNPELDRDSQLLDKFFAAQSETPGT